MAQTQMLKRRVRSVKNAKQITKAMEVVAASRMRKVQSSVLSVRSYADVALSIISRLAPSQEAKHHPYFKPVSSPTSLYVVFTSDRGLAGAFNSNVINRATELFDQDRQRGVQPLVVVFGRKGGKFFARLQDIKLIGEYEQVEDVPETNIFAPLLETIKHGYLRHEFNSVSLVYTEFVSTMAQKVQLLRLLPLELPETQPSQPHMTHEYEPSLEDVIEEAIRLYFESQLMKAKVESAASEYAMRMIAMNNANRNAGELIDDLTLELNATRQAAITQEIAEITAGAGAMSQGRSK